VTLSARQEQRRAFAPLLNCALVGNADTQAIGNKFQNKMIRGYDMQDEKGQSDDNIWFPVC
jgi:hypothetical protein